MNRRLIIGAGVAGGAMLLNRPAVRADEQDDHKAVLKRLFDEVYTAGNIDAADELLTDDVVPSDPAQAPGIQTFKDAFLERRQTSLHTYADPQYTVDDMVAAGDVVAARVTYTADLVDHPGERADVFMLCYAEFRDRRIARIWTAVDFETLAGQVFG